MSASLSSTASAPAASSPAAAFAASASRGDGFDTAPGAAVVSDGATRGSAPSSSARMPDPGLFWQWVWRAVRPWTGWILVGLGALVILIGYLGVSREALVAKQLPYVVSGGIFGLALVALGTFYLVTEELRRDSGRLDRVEQMVLDLHAVLLTRSDAPSPAAVAEAVAEISELIVDSNARNGRGRPLSAQRSGGASYSSSDQLVALPESQRYHRSDCRMVEGKPTVQVVSGLDVRRRGLQPCGMCDPQLAVRT